MDLKSIYQLVSSDNHVHCVASYDGAYRFRSGQSAVAFRYCFSSVIPIDSGKVLSYDVACNSCLRCNEFGLKPSKKKISEIDYKVWVENYKSICPAQYSEFASIQLESALSPIVIRQAYVRVLSFLALSVMVTIRQMKHSRMHEFTFSY